LRLGATASPLGELVKEAIVMSSEGERNGRRQ
jgi:hypothetical protein